jgi:hypothetical protein
MPYFIISADVVWSNGRSVPMKLKDSKTQLKSLENTTEGEAAQRHDLSGAEMAKNAPKPKGEGANNLRKRAEWFTRRTTRAEE